MNVEEPYRFELWDRDTANIVGAYPSLRALVQAAFALGAANPDEDPDCYTASDARDRSNQLQVIDRDRLARDLARLEAEPTTGIQTLTAQALFDKAKASATHEVTITAQELRLLLPAIENEAKGQVLRPLRVALDSTTGDERG